jgi:hypothetical protein
MYAAWGLMPKKRMALTSVLSTVGEVGHCSRLVVEGVMHTIPLPLSNRITLSGEGLWLPFRHDMMTHQKSLNQC